MAYVDLVGQGLWLPVMPHGYFSSNIITATDAVLLDADQEEGQCIGRVRTADNASHTFGTSGSKIDWLPGASITFQATASLRVGVKKASSVDTANGPAARATIGAAAFDVYKDLTGGTDTISSTTWRSDSMASGSGYTVADGDLIAVCWLLSITSNTQSIKVRNSALNASFLMPSTTLVTSGPTYTNQTSFANCILTFDDGTLGWLDMCPAISVYDTASSNIGNTNINGNIFQVPFACKIDALAATVNASTNAANFDLCLYSTPTGTPSLVEGVSFDANTIAASGSNRVVIAPLTSKRTLTINTDYCVGVKQTTATGVTVQQYDVNDANHFKPSGMGSECYAAISTAGGTFAQQNSGKRRYRMWVRVCSLDNGASGSGGTRRMFGAGQIS